MHVHMKQLASQVHSSDSFTQDALDLLPQVYALISGKGCMPLEIMTAASLFLSVRQANLPYTLAEMARLVGKPTHMIASAYKTVVLALNSGKRPLTKTAKRAESDEQQHNHAQQPVMDTEGRCKAPPVDFALFAMRHLSSLQGVKVSVTHKVIVRMSQALHAQADKHICNLQSWQRLQGCACVSAETHCRAVCSADGVDRLHAMHGAAS